MLLRPVGLREFLLRHFSSSSPRLVDSPGAQCHPPERANQDPSAAGVVVGVGQVRYWFSDHHCWWCVGCCADRRSSFPGASAQASPLTATVKGTAQTAAGHPAARVPEAGHLPGQHGRRARGRRRRPSRLGELRTVDQPARPGALPGDGDHRPVRRRREDHQPVLREGARHGRRHDDRRRQDRDRCRPRAIGHTFTIHAAPTQPGPAVRERPAAGGRRRRPGRRGIRLPDARTSSTFSFITGGKGDYVWNCEFPCGDGYYAKFGGPMSHPGYMSGTFTVG